MEVKFDYENGEKSYFGQVFRPVAKVSFKIPKKELWIETWMVVDTGADFSILPSYLSNDLQISLEHDCIKDITMGVGGNQTIYLLKSRITAKIGEIKRKVPIGFLDRNEVPPILGRQGFLETFDTEFLRSHAVVFKG
ncbi:hypothetical protein A2774_00680 [Candidatus Roizmanbacteria bacterium RIFCSPHIGHO2_01_FULL_39_12c]|uniref:Peptidase A2 domain-containing protein n=1 Tax=Candidatus Roizmanbacteria bacterium RIFCSPHIGHO2_01_FULL_39_12c TaxID=1802031 RepID=A0A1F7GAG1_9BACT|nr:MAG: hypothetical protein A2774_00680 [Candidatus Roizmanbacteria bacterium RIFCSPHIGHO2_01_FULL_39_12c]OGK47385.1 MAG: hypothetical protein A2963_04600 [Candidatus Roizmanbacteria bacterium RIFCSPLOWO2_01_FULL_40_13]